MKFSIHQAGHIGDRRYNQDRAAYAYSSDALLLVLADGMGGHTHGEIAADFIIDTFVELFHRGAQPHIADPDELVSDAMQRSHDRIMKFAQNHNAQDYPGSTCVAALIQDGKIYCGHAGDSRLYVLRDGAIFSKTRDHSMVQQLIEWGMINEEEARVHPQRNRITNCIGGSEDVFYVETGKPIALKSGDMLLLCSDGLWGPFTDKELVEIFFSTHNLTDALDGMIKRALEREKGHSDNISGIIMRWGDDEVPHDTDKLVCKIMEVF